MFQLLLVWNLVRLGTADYQCVCNHHTQREVYSTPDTMNLPIGLLYQDDCKALVNVNDLSPEWVAVQFSHQISYIEIDGGVQVAVCQGYIPDSDKVASIIAIPPTTSMLSTQSSAYTFASSNFPSVGVSVSVQQTYLPTSSATVTSTVISSATTSPTSKPPPTTTQTPTTPTQTTTKPTVPAVITGQVGMCPGNLIITSRLSGYLLTQHHLSCYQICHDAVSWHHASTLCAARGGHLVTIDNAEEDSYLHLYLRTHYNHAVWIGLNDRINEQHFQWVTGQTLGYTNWENNNMAHFHHDQEDCVILKTTGKWDDVPCGNDILFMEMFSFRHPYICEYDIHNGAVLIGRDLK